MSSSSSSANFNQIRLRRISLNTDSFPSQPQKIGRHLRRLREPTYRRKFSDWSSPHSKFAGIKASSPGRNGSSHSITDSTSSLGGDADDFDLTDVHSSCLALNHAPNRRTSFLYRADSSEEASPYTSRRPSVSCGEVMNL
ncbi:unnamed protein product [Mesocestoides corti]|uniref:DUF4797 domain-containing protein n=1 Tax=Mesocestoides corti TaxID=53468 RepID=A0A0R3UJA2_MESCO|nr:unnamed protein product [Mesocestoides corti]